MKIRLRSLVPVSTMLLVLAACGDDDNSNSGDAGTDAAVSGSGGNGGRGGRGGTGGGGRGGSGNEGGSGGDSGSGGDGGGGDGGSGGSGNQGGSGGAGGTAAGGSGGAGGSGSSAECGNGEVEGDEACDDDDTDNDDGCSSTCTVESGWRCNEDEPSVCTRLCGDGVKDNGEDCDDGARENGNGCSSTCTLELGWSCSGAPSACSKLDANVLIGSNLAALSTARPAGILPGVAINGIAAGETLVGIDRRPANGYLYALGHHSTNNTVQLYLLSSQTALATPLGTAAKFKEADGSTDDNITGTRFGFDFNPNADRIRVVTDTGKNFRIDPNDGELVDSDFVGTPASVQADGDIMGPGTPATATLDECAYTNNSVDQTVTTLYTIDSTNDRLYVQQQPNTGTQNNPGGMGAISLAPVVGAITGFDILAGTNTTGGLNGVTTGFGWLVFTPADQTQSSLGRLDLASGAIDMVSGLSQTAVGLAVQNVNVPVVALTTGGSQIVSFYANAPATTSAAVNISNIGAGQVLVDIDYRPLTGQLIGLGVNATQDIANLYWIDPDGGSATLIGAANAIAFVQADGTTPVDLPADGWSIDFNPQVDRLRVVNATGLNFRVNPVNGAPVDGADGQNGTPSQDGIQTDATISGLDGTAAGAAGVAYTNSWGGAGATSLYILDGTANKICRSSNPNGGNTGNCVALTNANGGAAVDIEPTGDIDFAGDVRVGTSNDAATGIAYAVSGSGANAHLWTIDITTGVSTDGGPVGSGFDLISLAVGHATIK
jgi:cysteine-rich repeat protein